MAWIVKVLNYFELIVFLLLDVFTLPLAFPDLLVMRLRGVEETPQVGKPKFSPVSVSWICVVKAHSSVESCQI